ncbi:hypothetical protein BHM03_00035840 [Ensete ventricosum]|nr:hypothetical protein BHM03_00035840 [Ensete ventricosum]
MQTAIIRAVVTGGCTIARVRRRLKKEMKAPPNKIRILRFKEKKNSDKKESVQRKGKSIIPVLTVPAKKGFLEPRNPTSPRGPQTESNKARPLKKATEGSGEKRDKGHTCYRSKEINPTTGRRTNKERTDGYVTGKRVRLRDATNRM